MVALKNARRATDAGTDDLLLRTANRVIWIFVLVRATLPLIAAIISRASNRTAGISWLIAVVQAYLNAGRTGKKGSFYARAIPEECGNTGCRGSAIAG